jgi:hypothetical protein
MKSIFGVPYFAFCFIVLILVLVFTKDMRDEGFFGTAPSSILSQFASTSVPELQADGFFDVGPGVMDQLESTSDDDEEGFFGMSPGTLTQLQSTSVPSSSSCSSLPPMSTSMMNPMSSPLGDLIQHNLTKQGILNMTEVPKKDPGFYALI